MIVAQQKRKENIAEYVLYMWQIEDLIRALDFDMNRIQKHIIDSFDQPDERKAEIRNWYQGLVDLMREEKIETVGHLQVIKNNLNDLWDLHLFLVNSNLHTDYKSLYRETAQAIATIQQKSGSDNMNEVEACFTALYGLLLMRLQNKEVSEESQDSFAKISNLLALLAAKYKLRDEDKLDME